MLQRHDYLVTRPQIVKQLLAFTEPNISLPYLRTHFIISYRESFKINLNYVKH
jgi:hypothetical protein